MDTPLLTIAEAAEKTGRSPSTVRRLIRTIAEEADHADRAGVEPSPKAVEAFKKKGENFTWKIREDILMKHLQSAPMEERKKRSESSGDLSEDILHILRRELELKNQQIEKQWDVIQSLNDRLREGNILMGSLQQRLAPPKAESPAPVTVDPPVAEASTEAIQRASKKKVKEAKDAKMKASTKDSVKPPKKGILSWMFR